jgi:four helix bundle protein
MDYSFKRLKVFQKSYNLAMEIFELTKTFPKEERYSLTDQIRRASRSVSVNIAEGYRKRRYPKHFTSKITDADAECSETIVWLDFSFNCEYISEKKKNELQSEYQEVGKMLGGMANNPEKFLPKT